MLNVTNLEVMGSEIVAVYYCLHKVYNVYGCWDKDTPEGTFDFFDIYEEGECINFGDPFPTLPTRAELIEYIKNK